MQMDAEFFDKSKLAIILQCLADGCWHSGEELGVLLGVTRAAVWKQLQKLELFGIGVVSQKGKGYAIPGGLDLLCADMLQVELAALSCADQVRVSRIEVHPVLDSTNAFIMRHTNAHALACLAELQTAGRGRRGRVWHSPFAQNLYLSLGWQFDGGVAALEGLSLAVGVVVAQALESLGFSGIELKWPNDVLANRKKLAGILIEMNGDLSGRCQVVIGIGLNVAMTVAHQDVAIDQPWTDLSQLAASQSITMPSRNHLAARLLHALAQLLSTYGTQGFAAYVAEWEKRNAYINQEVVLSGQVEQRGMMLGVNNQGAVRLQMEAGEQHFYGGEISLRAQP